MISPTPFRERLIARIKSNNTDKLKIEEIKEEEINLSVPDRYHKENIFREFFNDLTTNFSKYFNVLETKKSIENLDNDIYETHSKIAEECLMLQNLKFYQIRAKHTILNQVRKNITEQFVNISKHNSMFNLFKTEREASLKEIQSSRFFKSFAVEFEDEINYNKNDFNYIYNLNNYSMEILKMYESSEIYIKVAILGGLLTITSAIAGAIIEKIICK
jgi:hypothetical protein